MAADTWTKIGEIRKGTEIGKRYLDKYIWSACVDCGKKRWVKIYGGEPANLRCRSCAAKRVPPRFGAKHHRWKGGRTETGEGYIAIKLQPDDFFYPMARRDNYVFEHRLVMARHLGRNLQLWEIVHHKGVRFKGIKNRSDNRIDNLQLVSDDRHKQITLLERKIRQLEVSQDKSTERIKVLEQRVTLLEAENTLLREVHYAVNVGKD